MAHIIESPIFLQPVKTHSVDIVNIQAEIKAANILYDFFSRLFKGLFSVSRGDISNINTTENNSSTIST